ncbi:hypothetical protein, partial [Pantoea sp.]|uniref:hypothetical protein n=1 Tax=Pantoea sp. TaxID=69393 RepID=UPI0028B07BF4
MVSNVLNSRIHTPAAESLSIAGKSGSEEFPVLAEKNAISLFDALEMLAFNPEGAFNKTGSGELLNLKDEQWEMMAWLEAKTSVTLNFSEENGPVKPLAERMTCNGAPVSKEQFHKSMEALAELSEHNPVPEPTVEQAETPLFPALEEDMPEVKLPDLLKEHGKLQEFRRLGRLQEHLDVNMDEMKKVQTEMSERKWSPSEPSLKKAGDAIGELSKALAGLPPQSGHQKVGMMNAQLSLNGVAEALKKADAVLAGVAEHRKSGGVAQLAEGPEAVRRELQQALGKSSFMYLWQAVEVSEKDKPWSEQALLHKGLGNAYDEMKSDCEKVVKALEKVRDAYLRDVRSEQNGLLEEELALTKLAVDTDGADGMSARIRDAARALATLCGGIGSELSEEAGNRKTASLQNMKEAAVELRNLSAALHSAAAIREVTDAAEKEKGGEPVRALAVKALETVMKDLSKARESLKQHLKPGRINLTEKALSRGSHSQLAQQLEKAAAAVKSVKKAMDQNRSLLKLEVEVEKDAVDVFLHVLKSDRAMKATGRQWDKVVDVASALGHLAVKGWRATQTGMAHGFNPAEHSDFHSQIRGVVSGPLGMMVNVQRAMEDLAGAAMAASEKKPQVKRQLNDDCRALTPDQRKETLQQYREEKLAELDKKRVAAEQQTEMLGLVMAMTESELEDMLATFTDDRHRKSIGVLRNKCRATVKQCREATGKMCREMEQLVNPGGRSGIPATALRGKQDYKNAQRAIQKCLQSSEAAMKSLSAELAEITHKAINLFSKDAKLAKHIAGVVHASKAQIPENADEAQRARLLALFDRMVDELGPAFKTDEDPEGKDFAARVRRELMLHDMEVNLVAETPERAAEHLQGWVQKMTKKSSGKVSSEFTKRMAQTLLGQTAKSLLGGMFHGTKILKFGYSVGKAVESYLSDTQKLESTGTVERPVPQYMLDAVEKRLMCSLMEQTVSLFAPSLLKTGVQIGFMVNKVRQEGFSETMKETVAKLPENMVIDGGFQGIIAAGTVEVRALQETAATEAVQAATRSEGNAGEADKPKVGKGRPAEAHRLAEPQVKSRVGRSAPPDREQAASDARAVQPPVNAASEAAEDGIPVDASQKTSVGNTDATEFTMTEEEYNDTQIGIDVRNSTKVRTFIEKDIQDVIDRHPDGHGKITSPYSWVDTVNYKTKPPTFDRKRVIDIYTGNGVTDDVKILWEGGTGKRDSTDTTEAFRRDLFGHKPYKSDKNKPFEIIRLTPDDVNNAERSYTRLHQAWTNHMTGMRNRKPELATLYRNAFKLGFTNALNSSENNHSETEKTAIRGYLNGDTSGVITLRYNGQPVQDVIALVVPGTSENETHILVMDYDGNFKRVKATRELGEIKDGDTRYAFKPDEETQQFISRRLVLGDREKASAQRTQKVIMDPSSHYDTKLADRYLTTQD